jgi:antitoxin component of RelBE/YafQ-DinJ toxin-antitoxin module
MSKEQAYIKIAIDSDVKQAAEDNIKDTTGLKLTQWLRSKVYEAAQCKEDDVEEECSSRNKEGRDTSSGQG